MKKSTKKIFILIMSIALVACSFAVFSAVDSRKAGDDMKYSSDNAAADDDRSQETACEQSDDGSEEASIRALLGTEENLSNVRDRLTISDGDGNEIELSELEEDEYEGFIFRLDDPTTTEMAVMTEAVDELSGQSEVGEISAAEAYTADSMETIAEVVPAEAIEYVEPNYIAELMEIESDGTDSVSAIQTDNEDNTAETASADATTGTADADEDASADATTEIADGAEAANAEPESADYTPNDKYYSSCKWFQEMVKLPQVWSQGMFGSRDVTVAVIDSGVDSDHEDFAAADGAYNCEILDGKYYVSGSSGAGAEDNYWHGTFVTGLIAATNNNGKGVAGAMPNVKILPVKVFDSDNGTSTYGGYISDISKAIRYAADNGADVINMSLGIRSVVSSTLDDAVQDAVNKGIIIVAAAGNDYSSTMNYPASCDNVISVGSITSDRSRSKFSNYNDAVDVVAGGSSVYGLKRNNSYKSSSGTSFATPQITALAAMVKSVDPNIDAEGFENIIKETSEDLGDSGRDEEYGWGLADFEAALDYFDDEIFRCDITADDDGLVYDGSEKTPLIVIKDEGRTLEESADYTIEKYYDNTDAGTASVVIRGTGRYTGQATATFEIKSAPITEYKTGASAAACTYNGYARKPAISITGVNEEKLVKGEDYTVTYSNNVNACEGEAVATVRGIGNYEGSFELSFDIAKANLAECGSVADATYTGKAVCPTVNLSGMKKNSDYRLKYSSNTRIGYGRVVVTATGENTFGSRTLKFRIRPKGTTNKSPGRGTRYVRVNWKKQSTRMPKYRIRGYQVQIAKNSKFTSGVKTRTVKGYYYSSKKFTGLSRNTRYYTRVRTYYRTSSGTFYSKWSSVKSIKTR